jgi:hypothetical protein
VVVFGQLRDEIHSESVFEKDDVAPPLEGLWWADDPADFVAAGAGQ